MADANAIAIIVALLTLAALAWDRGCRCPKCSFHVNEHRMTRAQEVEARHNVEHRGFGYKDSDPDRFNCGDKACPRNR